MPSLTASPDLAPPSAMPLAEPPAARSTLPGTSASGWIARGSADYRRAAAALFLAGFASFSLIYCVQPLLPAFARSFGISPAQSALPLSLTTGLLAVAIVLAGAFSQALGRRGLMFASMALASLLNIAAAIVPSWHGLLVARALEGLVLGGVPAVAMAYLAEEIDPRHLAHTMGLYVAGTAFGGMMGRVGMGVLTEWVSWRAALGCLGALCLLSAIGFLVLLPRSRHFTPQPGLQIRYHLRAWGGHLRHRGLLRLFAIGFLLTSIFVTLFNYATFRLSGAPYGLSQTQISLMFLVFGFGIVSSSVAGRLADRLGRRGLLAAGFAFMLGGTLLTLSPSLWGVFAGIALVTTGFFIGHSIASSSIGPLAGLTKGHAASLYLWFYYMGSSVVGSVGGWFWQHGGWPAIVGLTGALAVLGIGMSAVGPRGTGAKA
ncbi:MFS transporter [Acidovorax sp. SUPP3434]|nr:MFS transporter [Acidovorax sp. SUPP3434]